MNIEKTTITIVSTIFVYFISLDYMSYELHSGGPGRGVLMITSREDDEGPCFLALQRSDFRAAELICRRLGEAGDANAQYNMALMYFRGSGVAQSDSEGLRWTRMSANRGYAPAQYNLGIMYAKGTYVPQNYVLAHMWLNLSAAKGYEKAVSVRELVQSLMSREQIAEAQRKAENWKPN